MTRRNEFDWAEVPYPVALHGRSEASADHDDDHQPHSFLYVPDLSVETGWSAHRVPERVERTERGRRPMGFRR